MVNKVSLPGLPLNHAHCETCAHAFLHMKTLEPLVTLSRLCTAEPARDHGNGDERRAAQC